MILSQTAVYALKAVLHLAEARGGGPVRIDDIAKDLDVPRNYLSKILHVRGGFEFAQRPEDVMLSDVIAPFDDIAAASGCLLGREQCSDESPCAAHERWRDVSASVRSFLGETTIQDLTHHGVSALGPSAR